MTLQDKLYSLLEKPEKNKYSYALNLLIYALILISIITLMISTIDEYEVKYSSPLASIQHIIMPIFVLEYGLRFYAAGSLRFFRIFRLFRMKKQAEFVKVISQYSHQKKRSLQYFFFVYLPL